MAGKGGDGLVEGHGRNHRGVAQRLQFHVAAILIALEFDDDEPGFAVEAEQVDAAGAVGPIGELLRQHEQAVLQRIDAGGEQALQVAAFLEPRTAKLVEGMAVSCWAVAS